MEGLRLTILKERNRRGWTQDELAKRCGVSRITIQKLESHAKDVRMSIVEKIAEGFGLTVLGFMTLVTINKNENRHSQQP